MQRRPRMVDTGYLAWLRDQPCACGCNQPPPCDAAHVRAASFVYDKPITGAGQKPDDRWALPLKHSHHMRQHAHGDELGYWAAHGVADVFALCIAYYRRYGGDGGSVQVKAYKPRKRAKVRRTIGYRRFDGTIVKPK